MTINSEVNIKIEYTRPSLLSMHSGIFNKNILKKTTLFLDSILWSDVFLIYQISKLGKIIKINEDLRLRRYFRDNEKKFENWEEKYKTIV